MSVQSTPVATVANFKIQFSRDFIYGTDLATVRDTDIQNALNSATSIFNPTLFSTELIGVPPNYTSESLQAYLYASAHLMVLSLQAVGGLGKQGKGTLSQGEGMVSNKSVGGVSIGFQWPSTVMNSPVLYSFTKTAYGVQYLQMLMPKLVGNVSAVLGEVTGFSPNANSTTGFVGPF